MSLDPAGRLHHAYLSTMVHVPLLHQKEEVASLTLIIIVIVHSKCAPLLIGDIDSNGRNEGSQI